MLHTTTETEFRRLLGLPERASDRTEAELAGRAHLTQDLRYERQATKAETRDARQARSAAEAMGRIPGPAEAFHLAISGRFALWDFVPAAIALAGCNIEAMHIATLGFSKRNVQKMVELLDAGSLLHVRLLLSHYFKGTSRKIYDCMVDAFESRAGRLEYRSVRTHAKLLLLAFEDGRRVTVESSANLRSCKNIEQTSLFGDPGLYNFHRAWIDELFAKGENRETNLP